VLARFAAAGINLTRIASMPLRGDPGNYSFFLDFEGSDQTEVVAAVLADVRRLCVSISFLGCYPSRPPG
jgi:prephenate dehydratase